MIHQFPGKHTVRNRAGKGREINGGDSVESDVDALFQLPLAEFTGARNALAARLKKSGHGDEAMRVKALAKPSISAWAVNQLYWSHREEFDQLIASGERFHKAQTSRPAGKVADMRGALDARREALTELSDLATSLLQDAGHNPALDTIRRITTTLEAVSAYASRADAPRSGRLTADVDPPGFELFAGSIPGGVMAESKDKPPRFTSSPKSTPATTNPQRKASADKDARKLQEIRKAKMAAAKVSLQEAKKSLSQARARSQSLEAAQKKAEAEVKQANKDKREAEARFEKAKTASEDAARHAEGVNVELEESATRLEEAELAVEKASKELESLFRSS